MTITSSSTVEEATEALAAEREASYGHSALRKSEIEEQLGRVAVRGLANIYKFITGNECENYVALGMATSAVATLKRDRDELKAEVERLKAHIADLNLDLAGTIAECNQHCGQEEY